MISICIQRRGNSYIPFSEEDRRAGLVFPEHKFLHAKIVGSKKERSYKELCLYFSSCAFIASNSDDENFNTKEKVHYLSRIKLGFIEDTVFDTTTGLLHWVPRSLSYTNCDSKNAHDFISKAVEFHAEMVGVFDVEIYIKNLGGL